MVPDGHHTKNGRAAMLALRNQAKGNSAKRTRKAKAYGSISGARYRSDRRNFNFAHYVQIHQDGHNELLELEEPVPEMKKVQDFLTGILDPKLQVGKDIILATPQYLQDFEECQQYLSTLVSNSTAQAKNNRAVGSGTHGDKDDDGRGPPKKKKRPEKVKVKRPLTARSYSNTKWYSLEDPEWKEVMDLRAKKPGKGKGKPKEQPKEKGTRSNSSVTSAKGTVEDDAKEVSDAETGNSDDTPKQTNSAGDEFGRCAHMNKNPLWGDDLA
jgi:hypothetical protein